MESLSLDARLLIWINQELANPFFDWFFEWISLKYGFSFPLLLIILLFCGWRYGKNGWLFGTLVLCVAGISDVLGSVLKDLFQQARPCLELHELIRSAWGGDTQCETSTSGMPSNHAMNFFATFSFICYFFPQKKVIIVSTVIASLVSFSRLYLGEHFPSQVMAGIIFGLILGVTLAVIAKNVFQQRLKFDEN